MRKRLLALLLSATVALSLCACGGGSEKGTESGKEESGVTVGPSWKIRSPIATGNFQTGAGIVLDWYYSIWQPLATGAIEILIQDQLNRKILSSFTLALVGGLHGCHLLRLPFSTTLVGAASTSCS